MLRVSSRFAAPACLRFGHFIAGCTSAALLLACQSAQASGNAVGIAPTWQPQVVREIGHDPLAFTQGLELWQGRLFETTGRYNASELRELSPVDGNILRKVALPSSWFGEGMTVVGEEILVLTWREQTLGVYDRETFAQKRTISYKGDGWGLCSDEKSLWMSNGSATLTRRDPQSFAILEEVEVHDSAGTVTSLNELECADGYILANIWGSSRIVIIEPQSGEIVAQLDGNRLFDRLPTRDVDVLNGIAYDAQTRHFFLTGKLWPTIFELQIPEWEALVNGSVGEQQTSEDTTATQTDTTTSSAEMTRRGCAVAPVDLAFAPACLAFLRRRKRTGRATKVSP